MKKTITKTFAAFMMLLGINTTTNAQMYIDFETLPLAADTFWNGTDGAGMFTEGPITFRNSYDAGFDAWNGFAYTNQTDTITNGYNNQYSSWAGTGYNNSPNYGVVYDFGKTNLVFNTPMLFQGFYFTNNTLTARNMRDGDPNMFAKKFGGITGNDPDYLRVITKGYMAGQVVANEVFYLADYRSSNNSQDYIAKDWTQLDLFGTSFGLTPVDSVNFSFESSDTSNFGGTVYINTPTFFCIDHIAYAQTVGITSIKQSNSISIFPNPSKDIIYITSKERIANLNVNIFDFTGRLVVSENVKNNSALNVEFLNAGMYMTEINSNGKKEIVKFIKE